MWWVGPSPQGPVQSPAPSEPLPGSPAGVNPQCVAVTSVALSLTVHWWRACGEGSTRMPHPAVCVCAAAGVGVPVCSGMSVEVPYTVAVCVCAAVGVSVAVCSAVSVEMSYAVVGCPWRVAGCQEPWLGYGSVPVQLCWGVASRVRLGGCRCVPVYVACGCLCACPVWSCGLVMEYQEWSAW